jgi:prepilin-type N-terminal cleavage/methylation domain-containing protein
MSSSTLHSRAGFSVVEIIVVLVIIGLMSALTAPILGKVLRGTVAGATEQQTAEEAYWATARMTSLLGTAVSNNTSNPQQLNFWLPNATGKNSFILDGNQIKLNGEVFWDNIDAFSATYANSLFEIDIRLVDASHPLISLDIFARNMQ